MKYEGISTPNMQLSLRAAITRTQTALNRAQVEYSTGRNYDVGLKLGAGIERNLNWRNQIEIFDQQIDTNKVAAGRAELAQAGIDQLKQIANGLIQTVTGARTAQNGQRLAADAAATAFESIKQILGTTYEGQHIYSGINTSSAALNGYYGGAPQTAANAAFLAHFGFPADTAATLTITPSQLQTYLSAPFDAEFSDPNWNANWSPASDTKLLTSYDGSGKADLSMSANHPGVRMLVKSVAAMMSVNQGQLNASTFAALADSVVAGSAQSIQSLGEEQARIGLGQEELNNATKRLSVKSDLLKAQVQNDERVDQIEAATRMNQLLTQLESSFAITAKISRLALTNYL